jgi:phosphodiesterase/alkaline phosphatase D-like protein
MQTSRLLPLLALALTAGCASAPAPNAPAPEQGATRQLQALATQAFYVSAPYASAIRPTSATINCTTGVPAKVQVEYGYSPSLGMQGPSDGAFSTSHHLTLGGLWAGTWYYVRVRATDAAGHTAVSSTKVFRTTW